MGPSFHNGRMRFTVPSLVWEAMKQTQGPLEHDSLLFSQAAAFFGRLPLIVIVVRYTLLAQKFLHRVACQGYPKLRTKWAKKPLIIILSRFEMTGVFKLVS